VREIARKVVENTVSDVYARSRHCSSRNNPPFGARVTMATAERPSRIAPPSRRRSLRNGDHPLISHAEALASPPRGVRLWSPGALCSDKEQHEIEAEAKICSAQHNRYCGTAATRLPSASPLAQHPCCAARCAASDASDEGDAEKKAKTCTGAINLLDDFLLFLPSRHSSAALEVRRPPTGHTTPAPTTRWLPTARYRTRESPAVIVSPAPRWSLAREHRHLGGTGRTCSALLCIGCLGVSLRPSSWRT
jgi:hypothetical protein